MQAVLFGRESIVQVWVDSLLLLEGLVQSITITFMKKYQLQLLMALVLYVAYFDWIFYLWEIYQRGQIFH